MKKIYIINGSGGKGKDSFVKYLSQYTSVFNISSVDVIKQAAELLGWEGGKTEKDRRFLSDLKMLVSSYNNHAFKYISSKINEFQTTNDRIMTIHVREPEEIQKLSNNFRCETILVRNTNVEDIKTNIADANVEDYEYDYVIENNGDLNQLDYKVFQFYHERN